jgi:two-component system, chemotaxis family, chemotaxis protein CheY
MMKRALLINDSRFESLILKDLLQQLGYTVEIADEFEALYAMERFKPSIVIVNYIMQQTRGDKLIQLMKAGRPDLKCLISTNSDLKLSDLPGTYVDAILQTPVSTFLLENVLEQLEVKKEKEVSTLCYHCRKDLKPFQGIAYCPFCGSTVKNE